MNLTSDVCSREDPSLHAPLVQHTATLPEKLSISRKKAIWNAEEHHTEDCCQQAFTVVYVGEGSRSSRPNSLEAGAL